MFKLYFHGYYDNRILRDKMLTMRDKMVRTMEQLMRKNNTFHHSLSLIQDFLHIADDFYFQKLTKQPLNKFSKFTSSIPLLFILFNHGIPLLLEQQNMHIHGHLSTQL